MSVNVKSKSEVLQGLNEQQLRAVTFGDGPLLIIAGAGTGKTTVLTRRIAYLTEQGLAKPEEILALTFTEKAANEMLERVDQLMPLGYAEISISTFHAFAHKILLQHALDIGIPGDYKVLSETQAWMLMQKNLNKFDLDYYRPMGNPTKFISALLKHFDKAKREGVTPQMYLEYAQSLRLASDTPSKTRSKKKMEAEDPEKLLETKRINEIANAYHVYQKILLDQSLLDYNDLINYTIELFKSRPKILKKYQEQFKYVLVDEFQDTDLSQYELVKLLAKPLNNITVVGDDDQSIYKFRGASISNILKFEEDYPELKKVALTDNYRSSQKILDLAYNFIQLNNPERLESRMQISKRLKSFKPEAGEINVLHLDTVQDEASMVADKIVELMEDGSFTFNDFCILVRGNDHADPFITELSKRGIPYIFAANRGLYKKPFILDILHYLKLLDNYHESNSLFRVLTMKKFRIPAEDLIAITHICKKKSLSVYEVLKELPIIVKISEAGHKKVTELLDLLHKHSSLASRVHSTELMIKVIEDLGIRDELTKNSNERSEDIGLLKKFYSKAQALEAESDDKSLKGLLNLIELEQQAGNTGELEFDPNIGPETVKIMTVHSSKGLEFRCVFIVNLVDARFPSRDRKEQIELPDKLIDEILPEGDAHLMEERRLFYVGVTRAKEYLFLTWAKDYGGTSVKKPSRFLLETGLESSETKTRPTGEVIFKTVQPLPLPKTTSFAVPETFSWTTISSFLKCPLEFKYKYLYQIPWPGNGYTSFGSSIHKTIQLFSQLLIQMSSVVQNDLFGRKLGDFEYPPIERLYKFYEENWIDEWYDNKLDQERFKQRGYRILQNYYKHIVANKLIPKETEKFFKLKFGNYKYVGVIDCIIENPDGTVKIIDYKTSQKARKKLEKVDKKQLLSYQWAAEEYFKKKVQSLSYWDLEDLTQVIEFKGSADEISTIKGEFLQNIEEMVKAIKADSFYELDLKKSHDCEFRDLEARN
ncbi:MAG TPA: ATP-dependent DNA helicase [Verrucomicrobiae bacterium]|nr:ATP-dependent DNA helicase [Verrucomicrobiae bacterium]